VFNEKGSLNGKSFGEKSPAGASHFANLNTGKLVWEGKGLRGPYKIRRSFFRKKSEY